MRGSKSLGCLQYGYIKDPQDKKKWIVDEEAAKVVQRIFNLCIAGKGPMQIAKILTADRVLTTDNDNQGGQDFFSPIYPLLSIFLFYI